MDDGFSKDLNAWLSATSDRYVVTRTLKQTATETTQVVYRKNDEGEPSLGPFVRKLFSTDSEQGAAYERLLGAQAAGIRLAHAPLIYECEHADGRLEVVMEYLQGQTLREHVESEGGGTSLAARVVPQLCDAIVELHESFSTPLIHRDIKPSNVMVCSGLIKLIDLGIARTYRQDASRDTVRYGTPGYAPPEQFGYEQTNVRSDVYALGMTTAYCLVGEDPSPDLRERAFADPRIPPSLQLVLTKATQFDPNNRYGSARELKQAFVNALRAEQQRLATGAPAAAGAGAAATGTAGMNGSQTVPSAAAHTTATSTPAPVSFGQSGPASAATASSAAQTYAPTTPPAAQRTMPHAEGKGSKQVPLRILGLVWDVVLFLTWIVFSMAVMVGASRIEKAPPVLAYMVGVFCVLVPSACVVYLLLDKRLFHDKIPVFANLRWWQEVLACIAIGVISFVGCALIVIVWTVATGGGS